MFGLRTWTINLRTWIFGFMCLVFKTTYIDAGKPLREGTFSSQEGHFSLRWIRGILAIRCRACVSLRRGISGSWACDALALQIEVRTLGNRLYLEVRVLLLYLCSRKSGGRAANDRV